MLVVRFSCFHDITSGFFVSQPAFFVSALPQPAFVCLALPQLFSSVLTLQSNLPGAWLT